MLVGGFNQLRQRLVVVRHERKAERRVTEIPDVRVYKRVVEQRLVSSIHRSGRGQPFFATVDKHRHFETDFDRLICVGGNANSLTCCDSCRTKSAEDVLAAALAEVLLQFGADPDHLSGRHGSTRDAVFLRLLPILPVG